MEHHRPLSANLLKPQARNFLSAGTSTLLTGTYVRMNSVNLDYNIPAVP
jgi:hypothetical protein